MGAYNIGFRRLTAEDLPLMHRWFSDPIITQIWNGGESLSYEETVAKYLRYIRREKPTDPYLILYDGRPIGYIQTYLWQDYPDYGQYLDLSGAASLDIFIGEAAYRGKGIGPELLSQFLCDYIFSNPHVSRCVITPEAGNRPAIRAYEKVGFRHVKTVAGIPDEPGPVYFMSIEQSFTGDVENAAPAPTTV